MMAALEKVVRLWGEKEAKVATLKTEAEDGGRGGQEGQGQAEGRRDPGARPRLEAGDLGAERPLEAAPQRGELFLTFKQMSGQNSCSV